MRFLCLVVALSLGLMVAGLIPVAQADHARNCFGRHPDNTPTDRDDIITGTDGTDVLVGGRGNGRFDALGGDDFICGDQGNDTVTTNCGYTCSDGDDHIQGGSGNDNIAAGTGNDVVGDDTLYGGDGYDTLRDAENTRGESDRLFGGENADSLDANDNDGLDFLDGTSTAGDRCRINKRDEVTNCEFIDVGLRIATGPKGTR